MVMWRSRGEGRRDAPVHVALDLLEAEGPGRATGMVAVVPARHHVESGIDGPARPPAEDTRGLAGLEAQLPGLGWVHLGVVDPGHGHTPVLRQGLDDVGDGPAVAVGRAEVPLAGEASRIL